MQCVILAAGRGERMENLTKTTPKPLLMVKGKNLIEHKLEILPDEITEVILVVGYRGQQIRDFFGDEWKGRKITYVEMGELHGTAMALFRAREVLHDRFLVMMGDDLYAREDLKKCLQYPWSILVSRMPHLMRGGRVILDESNNLKDIIEGSAHNVENGLVSTGLFVLQKEIFNYEPVKLEGKEEWGLPQTVVKAAEDVSIKIVEATVWQQVTDRNDLLKLNNKA